ncbi:hypothetical protein AB838_01435 [Rhodobacteraceae bacterium (ex Bugula neritina AB1)]|nr:hypothetical protein AB838_01435 [Rhodobacteraceae bacterium (ex Bugula neritina AB1)]
MISAVSNTASFHNNMLQSQARKPADGAMINGMPSASGRDAVPNGSAADALTTQYIGPARGAARAEALELRPATGFNMDAYFQDLMNGCQAGPRPVSHIVAEANYAMTQRITG